MGYESFIALVTGAVSVGVAMLTLFIVASIQHAYNRMRCDGVPRTQLQHLWSAVKSGTREAVEDLWPV